MRPVAAAFVPCALLALAPNCPGESFEVVDPTHWSIGLDAALVGDAAPAVAYYRPGGGLRFAEWDEGAECWLSDRIPEDRCAPPGVRLAAAPDREPAVFFGAWMPYPDPPVAYLLRFARRSPQGEWTVEKLPGMFEFAPLVCDLAFDPDGGAHALYFNRDYADGPTHLFSPEPGVWDQEVVETQEVDDRAEMAIAPDGTIHLVTWPSYERGIFHFLKEPGGAWEPRGPVDYLSEPRCVSLAPAPGGGLGAAYITGYGSIVELFYAFLPPGGDEWQRERVAYCVSTQCRLQYSRGGAPVICFNNPAKKSIGCFGKAAGVWTLSRPPLAMPMPDYFAFVRAEYPMNVIVYSSGVLPGMLRAWRGLPFQPEPVEAVGAAGAAAGAR